MIEGKRELGVIMAAQLGEGETSPQLGLFQILNNGRCSWSELILNMNIVNKFEFLFSQVEQVSEFWKYVEYDSPKMLMVR